MKTARESRGWRSCAGRAPSPTCTPEQLEALRVLVQDVRTAADRAEAALEEIAL